MNQMTSEGTRVIGYVRVSTAEQAASGLGLAAQRTAIVDTSTPSGRLVANVLASVAEWEGSVISARTRDGLAAKRAQGKAISRPAVVDDPALADWVRQLRSSGLTLQAVADRLNVEGVPTLRGGAHWRPSSVQTVLGYRRPRRVSQSGHLPPHRAAPSTACDVWTSTAEAA
jgi:DNA invertase Pin-like site-specific DNA recombinase